MTPLCTCPTCGQTVKGERIPITMLEQMPYGPRKRRLIEALVRAYPNAVTAARLIDAMYGDDIDGGPDDPSNTLNVFCSQVRRQIEPLGWTIPMGAPMAGERAARRLAPLEA